MAIETIVVPDLGGAETVEVIELSLSPGDMVSLEDPLLVLESDKASMDVPSPSSGKLVKYLVSEGDSVKIGDSIAEIDLDLPEVVSSESEIVRSDLVLNPEQSYDQDKTQETIEEPVLADHAASIDASTDPAPDPDQFADIYAGPAVRLLARELGVPLDRITGSGPKGRIIKDDINDYVKNALSATSADLSISMSGIPSIPQADFSQFGDIDIINMTKIQNLTATNMQRNWLNIPHVTHFDQSDITDMDLFRKSLKAESELRGIRVTPVAFLIKAISLALKDNPNFNRSLVGDGVKYVQKHYYHIGLAVDTPKGLMVPVVRDVNEKGLWDIAADVARLAKAARDGKLKPSDMQGGCFTLSSLGAIGGEGFTPIVNAPEVGILGVSNSKIQPIWQDDEFIPRLMLPLALSYDHRLINGGDAGRFMSQIVRLLSDVRLMAL